MKESEFKAWLETRRWKGKALTSVSNRMSRVRRFERSMRELGFEEPDLDHAFEADRMQSVTERLKQICKIAAETGKAPESLVGDSTIPAQLV